MPYLERQLYSGDLMVWKAGARLPGAPPEEYGPVAMGPASMAAMPQGITHPHQVKNGGRWSVQLPACTRRQEEVNILRISPDDRSLHVCLPGRCVSRCRTAATFTLGIKAVLACRIRDLS